VLERLIKNEKFHCKILLSMILLLLKHHSADQKGTDSTFKEQALNLIKKILKKKVWDLLAMPAPQNPAAASARGGNEDWVCVKRGLMIYWGNKANWSREAYRVWKDYLSERVREEMLKESTEVQAFVQAHSTSTTHKK
jgi:hypothetical protein